jgi:hypothetical protein
MRILIVGGLFALTFGVLVIIANVAANLLGGGAVGRAPSSAAVQAQALPNRSPAESDSVAGAPVAADDAAGQGSWHHITFSAGRGNKETPPFIVTSPEWRITWSTKNRSAADAGTLEISVYDDRRELVAHVTNTEAPGAEYIPAVPGLYRIRVASTGLDWDVAVEEQR